jgi:YD repeat-containing protein
MARYIGNIPYRNPDEEAYNFRSRPYTRSSDMTLDGSNRVTSVTYGDKRLSSLTYDAENKVTSYVETIGSSSYTVSIVYDASGNVTSITRT